MPALLFRLSLLLLCLVPAAPASAQTPSRNEVADSLYVEEVEDRHEPNKVLHAEPLFIDLIRDLGARKGERELNVGLGLADNTTYDSYTALVEYEWAPLNRLGLEVELPFSFYYPTTGPSADAPGSRLQSLKLAAQYTFLVSEPHKTSLALGYIHEFEFAEFRRYGRSRLHQANHYNPFFVAAKRWGNNFHTLLYTGPVIGQFLTDGTDAPITNHTVWQINTNFHYMIPGTRNFIGVELNKEVTGRDFDLTIRPQMRVDVAPSLLIGIVTGIPISRETERFSTFLRLIYEPGQGHR